MLINAEFTVLQCPREAIMCLQLRDKVYTIFETVNFNESKPNVFSLSYVRILATLYVTCG